MGAGTDPERIPNGSVTDPAYSIPTLWTIGAKKSRPNRAVPWGQIGQKNTSCIRPACSTSESSRVLAPKCVTFPWILAWHKSGEHDTLLSQNTLLAGIAFGSKLCDLAAMKLSRRFGASGASLAVRHPSDRPSGGERSEHRRPPSVRRHQFVRVALGFVEDQVSRERQRRVLVLRLTGASV